MLGMRNRKFQNYFVNPRFQWTYIRHALVLAVIVLAVVFTSNYFFFAKFAAKGRELGLPPEHVFFQFISAQQADMLKLMSATGGVVFLMIVIQGIRSSHRIAGPLYRLDQDLQAMAKAGELKHVRFRKKDFFLEIPLAFNELVDVINKKDGSA